MRGASLAECALALFIFVTLAFLLPVLDEQGYVEQGVGESHGPLMTADSNESAAIDADLEVALDEVGPLVDDSGETIEVAANRPNTFPLASLHVTGPQP